ncbi:Uncharacterised protein [uncultured Clostridium sp.]|nr:Uncharacterised protein [uncultured Clostridium sp.]
MAEYIKRSRLSFQKYDIIEDYINQKKLDAYDIVYTTDTHENVVIDADLNIIPIRSRVYRFTDITSANLSLNKSSDTYEGQIVAILQENDEKYSGYIVNKNKIGEFYVSPLSESGQIDYDSLGNKPVINKIGTLNSPITVDQLEDGIYKIRGQYKLTESAITIYLSSNDNFFLVKTENDITYIKKISAMDITDYTVNSDGSISASTIPTTKILKNYATKSYVDDKIAALDLLTKDDVTTYVADIINNTIDEKIETKVNEMYTPADNAEIQQLFFKEE